MSQPGPAKVRCGGINQIAIVVRDLEVVAENFWKILGIGPWDVYDWEPPLVYQRTYRGRPAWSRERIALVQVGGVQLELVQPVDGPSIYADWLEEHGEGLHHFNFLVDSYEELHRAAQELAGQGFPSIQSGMFGPPEKKYGYTYIPIPPLRSIWEPVHRGEPGAEPSAVIP